MAGDDQGAFVEGAGPAVMQVLLELPGKVGTLGGRMDGMETALRTGFDKVERAIHDLTDGERDTSGRMKVIESQNAALAKAIQGLQGSVDKIAAAFQAELTTVRAQAAAAANKADAAAEQAKLARDDADALDIKIDKLAARVSALQEAKTLTDGAAAGRKSLLTDWRDSLGLALALSTLISVVGGVIWWKVQTVERALTIYTQGSDARTLRTAQIAGAAAAEACCDAEDGADEPAVPPLTVRATPAPAPTPLAGP